MRTTTTSHIVDLRISPASAASAAVGSAACSCGQLLDCCHAQHCPRCGITLARRAG